ncbi:MAG: hypothetical protein ABW098_12040, partial [Candidatus Thiodiazotropha sp.]
MTKYGFPRRTVGTRKKQAYKPLSLDGRGVGERVNVKRLMILKLKRHELIYPYIADYCGSCWCCLNPLSPGPSPARGEGSYLSFPRSCVGMQTWIWQKMTKYGFPRRTVGT